MSTSPEGRPQGVRIRGREGHPEAGRAFARLPGAWKWGLGVWGGARLALGAWGVILWWIGLVPKIDPLHFYFGETPVLDGWRGALLGVWQRWDAVHYVRIARGGYTQADLSAFFPLYPFLGRVFSPLMGGDLLASLLLVSALATLLALVALFRLVAGEVSPDLARRSVLAAMLFPTGFILFAPYAESLTLALILLAYAAASRSRWGAAALAGLGAGLSRPTALALPFLLAPAAWEAWKRGGAIRGWLAPAAAVSPVVAMGAFLLWRAQAGFPSWASVQRTYWSWSTHAPWATVALLPAAITSGRMTLAGWAGGVVLGLMIVGLFWSWRRLPTGMTLYIGALLLLAMVSVRDLEPLAHLPRYALLAFPLFIALASWASTPRRRLSALAIGMGLHLYFAGQYFLWGWTG